MYSYLSQHPSIVPSFNKEVHFFDGGLNPEVDTYAKGSAWYRAHFGFNKANGLCFFEASPLYIFNPLAPQRIANLVPDVKLIVLLRNPTERAISHYLMEKRAGREPLPIDEALQKEEERLEPCITQKNYKSKVFINCSYKARGVYKDQLQRYFKFFSRDQMLCIASEDFFADPSIWLRTIYRFVGVNPDFTNHNLRPRNVGTNKHKVSPAVSHYLDSFFADCNRGLYELVNQDYGW